MGKMTGFLERQSAASKAVARRLNAQVFLNGHHRALAEMHGGAQEAAT